MTTRAVLANATTLLLLTAAGTRSLLAGGADEKATPAAPIRVLFIGNSYTYYNNMPEMVATLSGGRIETRMVARGSSTLRQLWDLGESVAAIREGKWDWVVLQEHSLLGGMRVDGVESVNNPEFFHESVRMYDAEIRRNKGKTLLYLTWARRSHPDQQQVINQAYLSIAQELGLPIAPVGAVWQRVRELDPGLVLHDPDGTHPNPAGSYLAACVFINTILGPKATLALPSRVQGHPMRSNERADMNRVVDLVNLRPDLADRIQVQASEVSPPAGPVSPYVPPARSPLPPVKRPFTAADLSGTWRGPLRMYAMTMTAELNLLTVDGVSCTGRWSITNYNDERQVRQPISSCRVTDAGVSFVLADYRGVGPGETYWAHFTGDTLAGWADYRGVSKSSRLMGSFELRKQR
ncbi:MAG: SGNH/GDSL hydrolase family protein [Acidobacteria bacterium]|nr:SGNH/GDSL hydrolase family protein [Acidobacteriota bacterium]